MHTARAGQPPKSVKQSSSRSARESQLYRSSRARAEQVCAPLPQQHKQMRGARLIQIASRASPAQYTERRALARQRAPVAFFPNKQKKFNRSPHPGKERHTRAIKRAREGGERGFSHPSRSSLIALSNRPIRPLNAHAHTQPPLPRARAFP